MRKKGREINLALNKVNLTINSRMYTLVSEESPEYMAKLSEHINEKIRRVLAGGKNIMGERPIVLAALNICDEYYRLAEPKEGEAGYDAEKAHLQSQNKKLKNEVSSLKKELEEAKSAQVTMAETEAIANSLALQKDLDEANIQIKFLEGQIKSLEEKVEHVKKQSRIREKELFDLLDLKTDE